MYQPLIPLALIAFAIAVMIGGRTHGQSTQLFIDRQAGPARVTLNGEVGGNYRLESVSSFSDNWRSLLSLTLTNDQHQWFDAQSVSVPQQFYHAVKLDTPPTPEIAQNFRLIDHTGKARELYYHWNDTNITAFVLIFTGNDCSAVQSMVPAINTLAINYAPKKSASG